MAEITGTFGIVLGGEWRTFATLEAVPFLPPEWAHVVERLMTKNDLFAYEGTGVEYDERNPYAKRLARRGGFFEPFSFDVFGGPVQLCGNIAVAAYLDDPSSVKLIVGFARSEEGVWFQHVWFEKGGVMWEPTDILREDYFGMRLSSAEAKRAAKELKVTPWSEYERYEP